MFRVRLLSKEHAVRELLHLPLEIATSFFFAASIGVGAGVATVSFTHRLGDGLKVALVAFVCAAAVFGFVIWRNHRPAQTRSMLRPRALEAATPH